MWTSLCVRWKWGFIDGIIKQQKKGTLKMEDWWTVQSMLVSWILNTIEPSLHFMISYMKNVEDLQEDIKERFSIVNEPRIFQLKSKLVDYKQNGLRVVAYYGKQKILWDELANYEQIPIYGSGGCKCDMAFKLEKRREEENVYRFLIGLDDAIYRTMCSNLLASGPLPSLNQYTLPWCMRNM